MADCFLRDDNLAGQRSSSFIDDMAELQEISKLDTRMTAFQICADESGMLTGIRLKLADENGAGKNTVNLNPIGPGSGRCGRYSLDDPVNEQLQSLTLYINDGFIQGVQATVPGKVGSFGQVDVRDIKVFRFTKDKPLIGLYGFSGDL